MGGEGNVRAKGMRIRMMYTVLGCDISSLCV